MNPLSVIQNIISTAQYIKAVYDQVKVNKQQCLRLSNRIEIILSPVKMLAENPDSIKPENLAALNDLLACLGECKSEKTTLMMIKRTFWAFRNQTDNETFRKLNDKLSVCTQQLSFALDVTRIFDRTADKKDIEEDLAYMEGKLNEIISLQLAANQQLDEVKNSLDELRKEIVTNLATKKQIVKDMDIPVKIEVQIIKSSDIAIGKPIGRGGIAEAHQARWDSELVAVKKLSITQMSNRDLKDFYNEANMMYRTRHPNIVLLQGIVQEPDNYMLVMELMEKGSLYNILNSNEDLPWAKRFNFAIDVASGMAYLHKNKIIHCDLKSLNILIDRHGTCKIGDFGLAKVKLNSTVSLSSINKEPKHTISNIRWKAPELLRPNGKYSYYSDIYSFGIILWEISERKIPFGEKTSDSDITRMVLDDKVELETTCPSNFAEIVQNCLREIPSGRPTFANICSTMEALVRDEPLDPLPVAIHSAQPDLPARPATPPGLPPLPAQTKEPVSAQTKEDTYADRRIKKEKFKAFWIKYWGPNTVSVDWADFFDCLSDYLTEGGLGEFKEDEIKQQFAIIHGKVSMNSFNSRTKDLSSLKELAQKK
ncbi:copper transport protein ctr1 [Terramyces sp. JEL0728]|nr:copper transport protein ctr1 [Terramyces sp. JEL0728]